MRILQALGLAGLAAMSAAALADNAAGPSPHDSVRLVMVEPSGAWRSPSPLLRRDRLHYLNGSVCRERRDCSSALVDSAPPAALAERDYIDALSLGSYGRMKFKFTGDRVKVKVRF